MRNAPVLGNNSERHFRLRTEFRCDCPKIIALLQPWIQLWLEADGLIGQPAEIDPEGYVWIDHGWSLDTEVQFVIKPDGPSLNEIRWLINLITDCHVPAQTLENFCRYTGERIHFEQVSAISLRPNTAIINMAIASLERSVAGFGFDECQTAHTIEVLRAHLSNPEPHMRKVAAEYAKSMLANSQQMGQMDQDKLANYFFENMSFDKNGAQCHPKLV